MTNVVEEQTFTDFPEEGKLGVGWCPRVLVNSPHYLGFCATEADFKAEMERMKVERPPLWVSHKWAGATTHEFFLEDKLTAIVCLNTELMKEQTFTEAQVHAMLVHEGMHVWRYIREHIGEREPSSEFEAYSMQEITQGLFVAYREWKAKQAKIVADLWVP